MRGDLRGVGFIYSFFVVSFIKKKYTEFLLCATQCSWLGVYISKQKDSYLCFGTFFFLGGRQTIDNIYVFPGMNRRRGGRTTGKLVSVRWSGDIGGQKRGHLDRGGG